MDSSSSISQTFSVTARNQPAAFIDSKQSHHPLKTHLQVVGFVVMEMQIPVILGRRSKSNSSQVSMRMEKTYMRPCGFPCRTLCRSWWLWPKNYQWLADEFLSLIRKQSCSLGNGFMVVKDSANSFRAACCHTIHKTFINYSIYVMLHKLILCSVTEM